MRARVLDPAEGRASSTRRAAPSSARCRRSGFEGVANVHVGRLVELDVEDAGAARAMCEKLLANPLIEDYEIVSSRRLVRFGVVQFPGSCDEADALAACERVGDAELLWHGDRDLKGVDAVVVPGGFSYGDYLRVGAIARFSPVMEAVAAFAPRAGRCSASATASRSSARRGCCPARCCRTLAALRLPPGGHRGRERATRRSRARARAARCCRSPSSTRPAATTRRRSARVEPTARSCCATPPAQNPNGSQRRHRRRAQRGRQRRRA